MRCMADRFVTLFTCVTLDSEVLLFKLSLLDLDKCITLYAIHVTHTSYAIVVLASLEPDATKVLMDNRVCIALKLSTPFNLRCKLKFMSQQALIFMEYYVFFLCIYTVTHYYR